VILVSVLLALAADAWWDGRQNRGAEAEYLAALATELADVRADFEEHVAQLERQAERAAFVFDALMAPAEEPTDRVLNGLVQSIAPPAPLLPRRAALDDLLESGGLSLLRSALTRRLLARYEQALSQDAASQQRMEDLWVEQRAPYRYEHTRMSMDSRGFLQLEVDRDAYLNNRTYGNLLTAHRLRISDVRRTHDVVLAVIGDLTESLD